jgi:hypothetical protein
MAWVVGSRRGTYSDQWANGWVRDVGAIICLAYVERQLSPILENGGSIDIYYLEEPLAAELVFGII